MRLRIMFMLLGLVLMSSSVSASPIIFTDRAAFDAIVGSTALVTFDTPTIFIDSGNHTDYSATIDGLLWVGGESNNLLTANSHPGEFCLCGMSSPNGFQMRTVGPVSAIGFDVTPLDPNTVVAFAGNNYVINHPQFLGLLLDAPAEVVFGQTFSLTSPIWPTRFTVDNVAIKTVPEPSSLLFLGVALVAFVGWHSLQRKADPA